MEKWLQEAVDKLVIPSQEARKGENGRVLVIGGSKLFHAASCWSAAMAARIVDLVHFSSPAMENNELMRVKAKEKFWDGIVVPWEEVEHYIEEDDAILIGPGMPRDEGLMEGERPTAEVVDGLLSKYPEKKWVVDGGALQEVEVQLLNQNHIVTPNVRELKRLGGKIDPEVTMIAKGKVDVVTSGGKRVEIVGGNAGMVKGGTGDVLAGLATGLYAKNGPWESALVASYVNKKAGEKLAERVGPYFSPDELLRAVPEVLWEVVRAKKA